MSKRSYFEFSFPLLLQEASNLVLKLPKCDWIQYNLCFLASFHMSHYLKRYILIPKTEKLNFMSVRQFRQYKHLLFFFLLSNKVVSYSDSEVLNFPGCLRRCAALTWVIPPREWSFIMSVLFRLRAGRNMKHLDMQIANCSFGIKWGSSAYETSHPASPNCFSQSEQAVVPVK